MSAQESFLSSPEYGHDDVRCDYVVAVTQDSINATALAFLNSGQPVVNVCYVYDDNGDAQQIGYNELRTKASGTDPFNIPAADPDREKAVANLDAASFAFGFRAAMGLPEGYRPDTLPDVVTLGASATDPVIYRLLCRNILLVDLKQIPHKKPVLQELAQPKGPAGSPWIFSYKVPLVHQLVDDNAAFLKSAGFVNLPMQVQAKLTAQPEDFTIRQLLYDFNRAASDTRPEIEGVDRVLREKLYEDFSIKYFDQVRDAGSPLVAVLPHDGDPTANLRTEFSIDPCPSQPKLATLNYLCAGAYHSLPPSPKPFAWQWVEPHEAESFDGVCVLNRTQLADDLHSSLNGHFAANRWVLEPVWIEMKFDQVKLEFGVASASHDWHGSKPDNLHTTEIVDKPTQGPVLLHLTFNSDRKYEQDFGTSLQGATSFEITATCAGNVLTVEQRAVVYCKIVMALVDWHEWNLVDVKITDTFTLAVEHDGRLTARSSSKTDDNSAQVAPDILAPGMKESFERVRDRVKSTLSKVLVDVPLSLIDTVVFPGGRGFLFKDVGFSEHQDLVAHITYADPS